MTRSLALVRLSTAGFLLAAALTACGGDEKKKADDEPESNGIAEMEPDEALRTARETTPKAGVLLYTGRLQEIFGMWSEVFDAELSISGEDCQLALTSAEYGSLEMRLVGERAYVKGSSTALEGLLDLTPADVARIDDRWIASPRPDESVCDPVAVGVGDADPGSCVSAGDEVIDSTPTVSVRCRYQAMEHRVYLATTGEPLVVRVETVSLSGALLTLVDTDTDLRIEAPPEDDIFDMTELA